MVSTISNLPLGDEVGARDIEAWVDSFSGRYSEAQCVLLRQACALAARVHAGERLESGETALRYLLSVADILSQLDLDAETLTAAILHDVLAGGRIKIERLQTDFGPVVSRMVADMARIGLVAGIQRELVRESEEQHKENLRRMLLSIADDVRVVLIILAECLHDMRTLKHMPEEVRQRVAHETQEIYAPLANRLGVWKIKWELEDLALRYLEPQTYQEIASQLDGRRQDRERFIADVIALLQEKLALIGIKATITGRPKHIYSIWRKMKRKAVDLDRIFDLRAVRVLVDSVAECYAVLGVVHGLWRYIPGEFDDYIATPKANMYQSLHTAVIGPDGKTLEVQIRTHEMHAHSEQGVAAHWQYKEGHRADAEFERRIVLMRNWLELKEEGAAGDDFFDHFKAEFEPVRVYVLTPKGRVIELPRGATPIDFAYAIHTDVGHRCRGARVDGHIVPLTQVLESGHTVEIITVREGGPGRDWLNPRQGYIRTARARNRVRQWFRQQDYEKHVQAGRAALERELHRLGVARVDLEKAAARFNLHGVDDLLAAIGRGKVSAIQVAGFGGEHIEAEVEELPPVVMRPERARGGAVIVQGVDDLMTHMARCCKPVPYDPIVGYITRGRGVTVHREDCSVVASMDEANRQRLIEVVWSGQRNGESYAVDVRVVAQTRKGLLRDLMSVCADDEVDVTGVATRVDRKTDTTEMRFTVEIGDVAQLNRVLTKLAQLPEVLEVKRQV